MASTITALQYYGPKDVRLEQVAPQYVPLDILHTMNTRLIDRPCRRDEVRIQIAYCGICGSDIHEYLGGPIFPPKPGEKNPWTGQQLPVTLGHEMSGTIVEVGASVSDPKLKIGARVAVNPAWNDRHYGVEPCTACQLDMPYLSALRQ
jgi:(R,R)-butanediol dehydrogenase/meso-butanediol dehydrogenase/diacetyl reductase